jgi:hypothetical protein
MLMWKPMRNPRASTGWSLEMLFMHTIYPQGVMKLKEF